MEFKGTLGAGVLVVNAGVVMLNKDCFHDLKSVGSIVVIHYFDIYWKGHCAGRGIVYVLEGAY